MTALTKDGRRAYTSQVKDPETGLTDREAMFVRKYVADPHRSLPTAMRAAGYPESALRRSGEILKKKAIRAAIAKLCEPVIRRHELTAQKVLDGLAEQAFSNILDYVDVLPDGTARVNMNKVDRLAAGAIAELTTETRTFGKGEDAYEVNKTKIKLADRKPALEVLAKHFKLVGDTPDADDGPRVIRLEIVGAGPRREAAFASLKNVTPLPGPTEAGDSNE